MEESFVLCVLAILVLHVVLLVVLCALLPRPAHVHLSHPLTILPAIALTLLLTLSGTVTLLLLRPRWHRYQFEVFLESGSAQPFPRAVFLVALWTVTVVLCATFAFVIPYHGSLRSILRSDQQRSKRAVWTLLGLLGATCFILGGFFILCLTKIRRTPYFNAYYDELYALADKFCQTGNIQPWAQRYCTMERVNNYQHSNTCVNHWKFFLNMVEVVSKDRGKPQCFQRALQSVPVCVLYSVEIGKTPLDWTQDAFGNTRDERTTAGWMNTMFPAKRLAQQFCQPNGTMEPVKEWLRTATQDSSLSLKWALFFYHVMLTHDYPCRDKALQHIPSDVDIFKVQEFLNALLTDVQRTVFRKYVDDLPIAVNQLKRSDLSSLQEMGEIVV